MTKPPERHSDPLIDEVRQRRKDLYESLGGTLEKLYEAIQQLQRQHPEKLVHPARGTLVVPNDRLRK